MDNQFYTDNAYGSTRLACEDDIASLQVGHGPAAVLGNSVIRFPDQEPTIITGGAGSAKFSQLGSYQLVHPSTQSFFVLDMGAQFMSVTWHDNLAHGREAYAINPFGIGAYPSINHSLNLWGILKNDAHLFDNAKRIADMAMREEGSKGDNAWVRQSAVRWISRMLIAYVLIDERVTPFDLWQMINGFDSDDEVIKIWGRHVEGLPYEVHATFLEIYSKKLDAPKEYGAIMGLIKDSLDWLSSPLVADSVSGDKDFLSYLPRPDKKLGVYYTLPGGSGDANQSLTRMVVGIAQLHCVRANTGSRPLFYLEEAATCGGAKFLKSAVSEFRKYFRSVLVYQSHGQLTHHFGKSGAQEIMDSAGLQIYMGGGIRDIDSARRLAETVGKTTIEIDDPMAQGGHAFKADTAMADAMLEGGDPLAELYHQHHAKDQSSKQRKSGRYLIDPAEMMRQKETALVISPGSGTPPALAQKLPRYWLNPAMAGRYGPDPLFPPLDRVSLRRRFRGQTTRPFIREAVPERFASMPNHMSGEAAYVKGYRTW